MALGKALTFVKQVGTDTALRKKCIRSNSRQELFDMLGFDETEFEDAVNMSLVKCQSYEAADHIQQIKMWFSLL